MSNSVEILPQDVFPYHSVDDTSFVQMCQYAAPELQTEHHLLINREGQVEGQQQGSLPHQNHANHVVQPNPRATGFASRLRQSLLATIVSVLSLGTFVVNCYSSAQLFAKPCAGNHHAYLIFWNVTYIVCGGNIKKHQCINLFLLLWANFLFFSKDSCSVSVTLGLIGTLIINLDIYIVIFGLMTCCCCCFAFCIGCLGSLVHTLFTRFLTKKANKQVLQRIMNKKHPISETHLECSICFQNRMDLRLDCGHCFHAKCIEMWATNKMNCPICRAAF